MQKLSLISILKVVQGNNLPASDAQINLPAHVELSGLCNSTACSEGSLQTLAVISHATEHCYSW